MYLATILLIFLLLKIYDMSITAPFVRAIVPKKLTSMTLRSTSMDESSTEPRELTPALFIRISIRPYKAIASRHLSAIEEGSERSSWSTFGE